MSKIFLRRGPEMHLIEDNFDAQPALDDAIYKIVHDPMTNEIYLEWIGDTFRFDFTLYGIDEVFVKHVVGTYNKQESKRNIGVIMTGAKGTGKTVTAKLLANKLGLPVILVDRPLPGLEDFLASIPHDCVFLFDEFEKNFRLDGKDNLAGETMLAIMDGARNSDHSHIFILTTNELKVNKNLLSRPSRIRYVKEFGTTMPLSMVEHYIDDNLKYPERKVEIMNFIDSLTMVTIDIIKCIVDEINIHNCGIDEFKSFFNVVEAEYKYYTREVVFDDEPNNPDPYTKDTFLYRAKEIRPKEGDKSWTWLTSYGTLTLKKSFYKLSVGDHIGGFLIEEVDHDKHFLNLKDAKYGYRHQYIYVENPTVKPSVFDDSGDNVGTRGDVYGLW